MPLLRIILTAALLLIPTTALADIIVLTSGGTQPALTTLAEQWTSQTGIKVRIVGGTVSFTVNNVLSKASGDVVVLPSPQFDNLSTYDRAGTVKGVGRVYFGLAQKAGQPRPSISSSSKFIAVLKAGRSVGFTDPRTGSAAGKWVADLLKRPEYAGVKRHTVVGMPGWSIARDGAQYALGPLSEEVTIPGVEAVGRLPPNIAKHFDYSAAVLKVAAQPKQASDFIAYVTGTQARGAWQKTGLEPN